MKSYVSFTLIGANCEEFLSEIINRYYKIYDIKNIGGIIYAKTTPKTYIAISRYTHKHRVRMRIDKKVGVQIKMLPYKKRYGVILGILAYSAIIVLCSSCIWDIKISGNEKISDTQLLAALANNGIYAGAAPDTFDSGEVEFDMKLALEDLSWISIEKEGARVNVKVNERVITEDDKLSTKTPCNVIAKHTGTIINTEVYRGTFLYEKGSAVREGDIIVSGIVVDTAGNNQYVSADAKIIAQFQDEVKFSMPLVTNETVRTGRTSVQSFIKFFSFVIPHNETNATENYIYESNTYNVDFLGLEMPWKILEVKGYETVAKEVTRTVNDVKAILLEKMQQHEKNLYADMKIVNSEKEFRFENNEVTLSVIYTLEDDIALQKEISIK